MNNENSLQIFNFQDKIDEKSNKKIKLRFFWYNNEVYVPFQDVRKSLHVVREHIPNSIKEDSDYSKSFSREDFLKATGNVSSLRASSTLCLTEAGLYEYISISGSNLGKVFRKWLNKEVLPSIRKTGSYGIDERRSDGWGSTRIDGKRERKDLTDVIKDFVEYAKSQGSNGSKWYYKHITSACNDALFGVDSLRKINKNLRDEVDTGQLSTIRTLEQAIKKRLMDLLEEEPRRSYKDIFNELKKVCMTFEELLGISKPRYISNGDYIKCMSKKRLKQLKNNKNQFNFLDDDNNVKGVL